MVMHVDEDILHSLWLEFHKSLNEKNEKIANFASIMKNKNKAYWNKRQKKIRKHAPSMSMVTVTFQVNSPVWFFYVLKGSFIYKSNKT
eukprot:snap_masked-scaffold_3-processed-gene-6.41-mRNA-1 protein AED:1.00 eAED:1.00 QI:0/0/0/0/1/1/2/0/87